MSRTHGISDDLVRDLDHRFASIHAACEDQVRARSVDNRQPIANVLDFPSGGKGLYLFSEAAGNAVYGVGRKIGVDDDEDD